MDDADNNLFYRVGLGGEATGIDIPGDGVDDSAGNVSRACILGDSPLGILVASRQPNLIESNTSVGTGGIGIYLAPGATSSVRNNDVFGRTIGIYSDSILAEIYGNTIHLCAVGMSSRQGVLGPDNPAPFGTPGGKTPNDVFDNDTGVLVPADASGVVVRFNRIYNNREVGIEQLGDRTEILANEVRNNPIGIRGTRTIGAADWGSAMHNLVHDNGTGIWGLPGAEIHYNRVYANVTGVTLHNNIVAAYSGYALRVAADSQFGYTSDYNNLYTGGGGKIAFQGKDFCDLYDWQVEAESDLHSIGSTRLNPTLDAPLFVGSDDYRLQGTSTSIDAGDPAGDFNAEPAPNGGRVNLGAFGNTPWASASHDATLDDLVVHDNGRHGIFVDSRLVHLLVGHVYDNGGIGIALRSAGATIVESCNVHGNLTGIDIINPGANQAVIGHGDLTQQRGNTVHQNQEDGISALLSSSEIRENRSYANTDTGIEASFASILQQNVTYSNDVYGIHVTRFEGRIDHNLVYETGSTSLKIEGPGTGAVLENNTIYEPCAGNAFEPPPGRTTIEIPWAWEILLQQFEPPGVHPLHMEGTAQIVFAAPFGLGSGGTFDLGPGGGLDALIPEAVPPGEEWRIETEIVGLELASITSTELGPVLVGLSPSQHCYGAITVQNIDGVLVGSSTFYLYVQFTLPSLEKTLVQTLSLTVGATFDYSAGLGARQVLRMPIPLAPQGPWAELQEAVVPPPPPWGQWQMVLGQAGRAPQHPGLRCAEIGILVTTQSAHVLLRNNIVYVEGSDSKPVGQNTHDIIVTADSTTGWRSDFNLFTTRYGNIGQWAGTDTPTLAEWQTASADDDFTIDPDPNTIWVDPDGADNFLGFNAAGAGDGRDDNLHLRSPFGEPASGALAPAEDLTLGPLPAVPTTLPLAFQSDIAPDVNNLSLAVDWGDPAYWWLAEPVENGKFIDLGTYGNTSQAFKSEPEYIHLDDPLGFEELVPGRTYGIQWLSHDTAGTVLIELRQGNDSGPIESTIGATAPNTGNYSWTVPSGLPVANDYVVVIKRPSLLGPGDVVGSSRRRFSIGPDTMAPIVNRAAPAIVGWQLSTNADLSTILEETTVAWALGSCGTSGAGGECRGVPERQESRCVSHRSAGVVADNGLALLACERRGREDGRTTMMSVIDAGHFYPPPRNTRNEPASRVGRSAGWLSLP